MGIGEIFFNHELGYPSVDSQTTQYNLTTSASSGVQVR